MWDSFGAFVYAWLQESELILLFQQGHSGLLKTCYLVQFFCFICPPHPIQVQWAQAVVHSPTKDPVGSSWWWAVAWAANLLHWHSQGRNSMVPCPNVFINGYSAVISHGGVFLLGLPILLSEICSQLVAFQWVITAPNPALTVWAVSYWGQWVFHLTSIEVGLGHWQNVFKNCLQQISL